MSNPQLPITLTPALRAAAEAYQKKFNEPSLSAAICAMAAAGFFATMGERIEGEVKPRRRGGYQVRRGYEQVKKED